MDTRRICFWSIPLLVCGLSVSQALFGDTVPETYSFTGSAHNEVIANGFLTADGIASGSLSGASGVVFDTHNDINLTTLQNYGTFSMILPDGDTVFGTLYEDDIKVSLATFSGPFTQMLTITGGTGQFADVSGVLNGGGLIHPTYYTTSGAGTLTAPGLLASPEPRSGILLLIGAAIGCLLAFRRRICPPVHL